MKRISLYVLRNDFEIQVSLFGRLGKTKYDFSQILGNFLKQF
jgi:hypothetical protein